MLICLVGFGCFMVGFGIAAILHASKDNVDFEKEMRRTIRNEDINRKGRNIKSDLYEGLGV